MIMVLLLGLLMISVPYFIIKKAREKDNLFFIIVGSTLTVGVIILFGWLVFEYAMLS